MDGDIKKKRTLRLPSPPHTHPWSILTCDDIHGDEDGGKHSEFSHDIIGVVGGLGEFNGDLG